MPFKYLAQVFTLALAVTSCAPAALTSTPTPTASATASGAAATPRPAVAIPAHFDAAARRWYLVPDPRSPSAATVRVVFDSDPGAARPIVRVRSTGAEAPLTSIGPGSNVFVASFAVNGMTPGADALDVVERVAGNNIVVATKDIVFSEPEYIVWTLDFEGDASSDQAMANTAAIADEQKIPMTIM